LDTGNEQAEVREVHSAVAVHVGSGRAFNAGLDVRHKQTEIRKAASCVVVEIAVTEVAVGIAIDIELRVAACIREKWAVGRQAAVVEIATDAVVVEVVERV